MRVRRVDDSTVMLATTAIAAAATVGVGKYLLFKIDSFFDHGERLSSSA